MAAPTAYSIGFTGKTAEKFFGILEKAGIQRLVDVRIHNTSQLAGFTKQNDLKFFLDRLLGAEYAHLPILAPTEALLKSYRSKKIGWSDYEVEFLALMKSRRIESEIQPEFFEKPSALLCSEATADECHRRLVLEYLRNSWKNGLRIVHL